MLGQTPRRCLIGSLASALMLIGALAACGEQSSLSVVGTGPRPTVRLTPVAQITVPPGRALVPRAVSPTPRAAGAIVTIPPVVVVIEPPDVVTKRDDVKVLTLSPTPLVPLTSMAEAGRRIFAEKGCLVCHGKDLKGGIGPPLSGRSPRELTDDRIRGEMPVFGFSEQEVLSVIAFIRSQA